MTCGSSLQATILSFLVCAAALAQNPAASVMVDANANRRPIDPRVYGIAYGTTAQLSDLNVPLNRYGGNNTSRYNWQLNADNRGQDWYFESIPESSSTPGERGNTFISQTQAAASGGKGSAKLNWTDNSTNETGFQIERAPSGSTSFVLVGTVGANVKAFTHSVSRGNYLYRVRAFNASSVSAYSNTVSVRVR